jgi:YVTN family beta-propeller protein
MRLSLLFFVLALACGIVFWSRMPNAEARPKALSADKLTPAGRLLSDATTGLPAVAPLTMNFVRSPDQTGPDHKGRFLIAVNSGYGIEFTSKSKQQQTLSIIDLNQKPEPQVVQNIYFPQPQSANVGLVFDPHPQPDGRYRFFVSGGFENRIWLFGLDLTAKVPVSPANKPDEPVKGTFVDVSGFTTAAPSPNYNRDTAAVYPTGIDLSPDGEALYSANDLGDTLGIVSDLRNTRKITRISLSHPDSKQFVYPYDVKLLAAAGTVKKAYVSLWGDGSVAVVDRTKGDAVSYVTTGRHPTLMTMNAAHTRLYVVNSDGDTVSVIDTRNDKLLENINVRIAENARGMGPEGLALSQDEKELFVANAHANAVAVVHLSDDHSGSRHSELRGFIPTGNYPSALAVVGKRLFIGNGKGTGMENSSLHATLNGLYPNMPNKDFPADRSMRGTYSVAIVSGDISMVDAPDEKQLFAYTQGVMRNNGLLGRQDRKIFAGGRSPFKHVIYIIRENRSYDQVFGDLKSSGDATPADGDPAVAIFGAGQAAKSPTGGQQNITPNARALALRFGLFDRFFVNAEASPDGHNWSTAAFSSDYIDKAFRWNYSRRGRTYDFEGFNRMPTYEPPGPIVAQNQPPVALAPVFDLPATPADVANFERRYLPYLNGARDIGEPETLYLWDAAQRAGLSYRNYGEFVDTASQADVNAVNVQRSKTFPDLSPNVVAFASTKSLEGHFCPECRNFDLQTPDAMTPDTYRAVLATQSVDPVISPDNPNPRFRGTSRVGEWLHEFRAYAADRKAGRGDNLPNLSILRLSSDHTAGMSRSQPTPQFYVAENDYALGRLVEEVSSSPYWADTAIFVLEDDAQDGPDHVDAHRSPALVISAYNRPGTLVHEFHNTVSLIRTMELCIGIQPMNFLDSNATPIDIFSATPDMRPYHTEMPSVALDNLFPPAKPDAVTAYYMRLTEKQDLTRADMADPAELNEIIWYSVMRNRTSMPGIARLPTFELMKQGIRAVSKEDEHEGEE